MLTHPIPSTLDPAARTRTAMTLQPTLIDLIDLALTAKQLHWTVIGGLFAPLHALLDAVAADARDLSDTVAERLVAIGSAPDGRAVTVASDSVDDAAPEGFTSDATVMSEMVGRLGTLVERLRTRIREVAAHDPVTEDLLIGIVAGLEKHRWMFAAQRG